MHLRAAFDYNMPKAETEDERYALNQGKKPYRAHRRGALRHDTELIQKQFKPGDKLPNEFELSARLGVSRATLREAVSALIAQGVLVVKRGSGTFIANELPNIGDVSISSIDFMRVRLSDLYEIRLMFEPQSVKLACERADESELAAIEEQAKKVNRLLRSDGNWPDADQEFHEMIGAASHNEFISRLFPIINSAVHEVMLVSTNQKLLKDIVRRDNALIVEFIMKRDGDGASHAMSIHIRHMINALKLNS